MSDRKAEVDSLLDAFQNATGKERAVLRNDMRARLLAAAPASARTPTPQSAARSYQVITTDGQRLLVLNDHWTAEGLRLEVEAPSRGPELSRTTRWVDVKKILTTEPRPAAPTDSGTPLADLIAQTTDDQALAAFGDAMLDAERDNEAEDVVVPYHIAHRVIVLAMEHPSRAAEPGVADAPRDQEVVAAIENWIVSPDEWGTKKEDALRVGILHAPASDCLRSPPRHGRALHRRRTDE